METDNSCKTKIVNDILSTYNKTLYSESSISKLIDRITNIKIIKNEVPFVYTEEDKMAEINNNSWFITRLHNPSDELLLTAIAANNNIVLEFDLLDFSIDLLIKIKLIII